MKFQITQEHINNGRRVSASACPIALAIKEKVVGYVGVTGEYVAFMAGGEKLWDSRSGLYATIPKSGYDFITSFDHALDVEPFELELEIPEGVMLK